MDFDRWFQTQGRVAPAPAPSPDHELAPGIREVVKTFPDGSGKYLARCRSCERDYELDLDRLEDFDPDVNYCGGSPWCLP